MHKGLLSHAHPSLASASNSISPPTLGNTAYKEVHDQEAISASARPTTITISSRAESPSHVQVRSAFYAGTSVSNSAIPRSPCLYPILTSLAACSP